MIVLLSITIQKIILTIICLEKLHNHYDDSN